MYLFLNEKFDFIDLLNHKYLNIILKNAVLQLFKEY